jgi:hypothetical protein
MTTRVLKHLGIGVGVCLAAAASFAYSFSPSTFDGVLIDSHCSYKAETRIVPGGLLEGGMLSAYAHTKSCLLMQECQRSGYGIFTYDQKFLKFDAAGNQKALALIKNTADKDDDYRIEATGELQGDTLKVTSLKLK